VFPFTLVAVRLYRKEVRDRGACSANPSVAGIINFAWFITFCSPIIDDIVPSSLPIPSLLFDKRENRLVSRTILLMAGSLPPLTFARHGFFFGSST